MQYLAVCKCMIILPSEVENAIEIPHHTVDYPFLKFGLHQYCCHWCSPFFLVFTGTVAVQWTTVGDVDIDIGANPSAEEADEGVESTDRKTVDIIESFRLNVSDIVSQLPIAGFCIAVARSIVYKSSLRPLVRKAGAEYAIM